MPGVAYVEKSIECPNCGYERIYRVKDGEIFPRKVTRPELEACKLLYEGDSSDCTSRSITKADAVWTVDQWKGKLVRVYLKSGAFLQEALVVSNSVDTLQLSLTLKGGSPVPTLIEENYIGQLFKDDELPSFKIVDEDAKPTEADIRTKIWGLNKLVCVCGTQIDNVES